MNVVLVLLLIAGPIAGGIIGKELSTYRANYTVVGILIGLLAALFFDFLIMPPVLVLFEINKKLSNENEEKAMQKSNDTKEETVVRSAKATESSKWLCSNCGTPNPADKTSCSYCFTTRK
jgi:mannitol-specific phosphotransferase system IIBC component